MSRAYGLSSTQALFNSAYSMVLEDLKSKRTPNQVCWVLKGGLIPSLGKSRVLFPHFLKPNHTLHNFKVLTSTRQDCVGLDRIIEGTLYFCFSCEQFPLPLGHPTSQEVLVLFSFFLNCYRVCDTGPPRRGTNRLSHTFCKGIGSGWEDSA
eukprot:TRINITY_DN7537_c0_g1_i1.p1 TRINITY_DN7537_c0_g1~~TRINITY_DN7537_c0_g1_i1.p1  ORF type:complete len:151 (+),score=10.21 TRINITY_DN7537_c0_g1_i1:210-662(+)